VWTASSGDRVLNAGGGGIRIDGKSAPVAASMPKTETPLPPLKPPKFAT